MGTSKVVSSDIQLSLEHTHPHTYIMKWAYIPTYVHLKTRSVRNFSEWAAVRRNFYCNSSRSDLSCGWSAEIEVSKDLSISRSTPTHTHTCMNAVYKSWESYLSAIARGSTLWRWLCPAYDWKWFDLKSSVLNQLTRHRCHHNRIEGRQRRRRPERRQCHKCEPIYDSYCCRYKHERQQQEIKPNSNNNGENSEINEQCCCANSTAFRKAQRTSKTTTTTSLPTHTHKHANVPQSLEVAAGLTVCAAGSYIMCNEAQNDSTTET